MSSKPWRIACIEAACEGKRDPPGFEQSMQASASGEEKSMLHFALLQPAQIRTREYDFVRVVDICAECVVEEKGRLVRWATRVGDVCR